MLARVTEAHNVVSSLLSDLRSRYSTKSPAVKAAAKAERDLFHLKREILRMDLEGTPCTATLPEVRRGGKVVEPEEL